MSGRGPKPTFGKHAPTQPAAAAHTPVCRRRLACEGNTTGLLFRSMPVDGVRQPMQVCQACVDAQDSLDAAAAGGSGGGA